MAEKPERHRFRRVIVFDHEDTLTLAMQDSLAPHGVTLYRVCTHVHMRRMFGSMDPDLLLLDHASLGDRAMEFIERLGGRWGRPIRPFAVMFTEEPSTTREACRDLGAIGILSRDAGPTALAEHLLAYLDPVYETDEEEESRLGNLDQQMQASDSRIRFALDRYLRETTHAFERLVYVVEQERAQEFPGVLADRLHHQLDVLKEIRPLLMRMRDERSSFPGSRRPLAPRIEPVPDDGEIS